MDKQKLKKLISTVLVILVFAAVAYTYISKQWGNGKDDPADTTVAFSIEDSTPARPTAPPDTEAPTAAPTEPERTSSEPLTLIPDTETEAQTEKPTETVPPSTAPPTTSSGLTVREDGEYDDKDHVALYIHTYGKLPSNYITKKQAENLGWPGGSLEKYAPGKSIGGSVFGNYEGQLPKKSGRKYYECDIDTKGKKSRGAKRIVYSNDGLIFYTDDHYEHFEQLY